MAHREQHSNRETKKPKKSRPREETGSHHGRWSLHEDLERQAEHTRKKG